MTVLTVTKQTFRASMSPVWAVAVLCSTAFGAVANESPPAGDVRIEMPWARASIGTGRPVAAFVTVINDGNRADRLVKIDTPVAAKAEVHETTTEDGVSRMNRIERLTIDPKNRVEFQPGGLHIMLFDLHMPIKDGETFPLDMYFERAGRVSVTVLVAGPGASGPPP